jgi:hypothetical protein
MTEVTPLVDLAKIRKGSVILVILENSIQSSKTSRNIDWNRIDVPTFEQTNPR